MIIPNTIRITPETTLVTGAIPRQKGEPSRTMEEKFGFPLALPPFSLSPQKVAFHSEKARTSQARQPLPPSLAGKKSMVKFVSLPVAGNQRGKRGGQAEKNLVAFRSRGKLFPHTIPAPHGGKSRLFFLDQRFSMAGIQEGEWVNRQRPIGTLKTAGLPIPKEVTARGVYQYTQVGQRVLSPTKRLTWSNRFAPFKAGTGNPLPPERTASKNGFLLISSERMTPKEADSGGRIGMVNRVVADRDGVSGELGINAPEGNAASGNHRNKTGSVGSAVPLRAGTRGQKSNRIGSALKRHGLGRKERSDAIGLPGQQRKHISEKGETIRGWIPLSRKGDGDSFGRSMVQKRSSPGLLLNQNDSKVLPDKRDFRAERHITFLGTRGKRSDEVQLLYSQSGSRLVSRPVIVERISHIIYTSASRQVLKTTVTVDGGGLGSMEIRFVHEAGERHATIAVESDAVRAILQKVLPAINESLSQKGITLNSLEIELNDSGKRGSPDEQVNEMKKFSSREISQEVVQESFLPTEVRNFGYNTIELVA